MDLKKKSFPEIEYWRVGISDIWYIFSPAIGPVMIMYGINHHIEAEMK